MYELLGIINFPIKDWIVIVDTMFRAVWVFLTQSMAMYYYSYQERWYDDFTSIWTCSMDWLDWNLMLRLDTQFELDNFIGRMMKFHHRVNMLWSLKEATARWCHLYFSSFWVELDLNQVSSHMKCLQMMTTVTFT